ncbi:MAG: hypothetical protein CMF31_02130 [Kordiimonas sp.]|nr:hypothetical protein [Kordiimonas sp.]
MIKQIRLLQRYSFSALSFGLSKSAVLLGPLLLSNVLTVSDYGLVEGALAYAAIGAVLLNLGISSAIPQFLITEDKKQNIAGVYIHLGGVSLFLLAVSVAALFSNVVFGGLVLLLVLYSCFQRVMSVEYAAKSHPVLSSMSGSYMFFLLLLAGAWGYGATNMTLTNVIIILVIGLPVLLIWLGMRLDIGSVRQHSWSVQKTVYAFSVPNLVLGLFVLAFVSSVRLLGVPLFGAGQLGEYAFFFRLASIPVVLYQFLNVIWYQQIYSAEPRPADRLFCRIIIISLLALGVGYALIPAILSGYAVLLEGYTALVPDDLYLWSSIFAFFWIAIAMTELLIYREKLALKTFLIDGGIFLLLLVGFLIWSMFFNVQADIVSFVKVHIVSAGLVTFAHCEILRRVGVYLKGFFVLNILIFTLVLILIAFF